MLTKDLLRVSRAGGGYQPRFVDESRERLAARVLGIYQGHVGERRESLQAALTDLEGEVGEFKLVRGFAKLLEREATFEIQSAIPPERTRKRTFEAAEAVGVVTESEREEALHRAADRLGVDSDAVEFSLYADLEDRQILTAVDPRWSPDELRTQYNFSLAQTALFDATEIRIRSADPKALVSAVKRLRLLYEVRTDDDGEWEVVVTGPDALFSKTRRYGTRFARLLRSVATAPEWELTATIDDRGTERTMTLSETDLSVPGVEPVTEVSYDSGVEADFATRFQSLDLDWELVREPAPLAVGESVMIPDFAFDYRFADYRIFFEIMGFWTPEYVEKKLGQLAAVEDMELLVAVDESLGVSEAIEDRDHRAIPYSGSVRLKDVRDALRRYEDQLVTESRARLPDALEPDADVLSLSELAAENGVSETALDDVSFPAHRQVGRTMIRPAVIEQLADVLEPGLSLSAAEEILDDHGISETSAVLSELGYEVAWEGLSGGTLQTKE